MSTRIARIECGQAMNINWQVLLTTLGGGTAILAAAAWLIRTALNHALTRDAEAFKARLKADTDIEAEKLKSSLQMVAFEHQRGSRTFTRNAQR